MHELLPRIARPKMSLVLTCLTLLLLILSGGFVSAGDAAAGPTTPAVTVVRETTPAGGSVFFETSPPGATVAVNGTELAASPFTYYFEGTGTKDVLIWKKGYENYTGTVTVEEGRRVVFSADLVPVKKPVFDNEETPVPPVSVRTTIRRSTIPVPTSWPTTKESPADPAAGITAAALACGCVAARRR